MYTECTSLCTHSDNTGTVPSPPNKAVPQPPTGSSPPTLGQYFKWCEMRQPLYKCATVVAGIVVGAVVGALSLIILVSVAIIILLGKYIHNNIVGIQQFMQSPFLQCAIGTPYSIGSERCAVGTQYSIGSERCAVGTQYSIGLERCAVGTQYSIGLERCAVGTPY